MGKQAQRLGAVLAGRMQRTVKAHSRAALELGTIGSDLSLTIDGMAGRVSPTNYMVDLRLTHDTYKTDETTHSHDGGDHSHSDGEHRHRLPSVFRKLEPGDRVLVAWVGNEPVIVAIVISGATITSG